jgi:hypothetical protein
MGRQVATLVTIVVLFVVLASGVSAALMGLFRESLEAIATVGVGVRRGGPTALNLLAGGLAGYLLVPIRIRLWDSVGLLIDGALAVVAGASVAALSFALAKPTGLPAGIILSVAGGTGLAFGAAYAFRVWREETW